MKKIDAHLAAMRAVLWNLKNNNRVSGGNFGKTFDEFKDEVRCLLPTHRDVIMAEAKVFLSLISEYEVWFDEQMTKREEYIKETYEFFRNNRINGLSDEDAKKALLSISEHPDCYNVTTLKGEYGNSEHGAFWWNVKGTKEFILKFFPELNTPDKIKNAPQQIHLPDEVMQFLQSKISKSGNLPFIKKCNDKWKWLQNKQNARVLLTHEAIKGNLSDEKAKEQAPTLFIYGKNNEPLILGKNDTRRENTYTDDLRNFLDGLKRDHLNN